MDDQQILLEEFSPYRMRKDAVKALANGDFSKTIDTLSVVLKSPAALPEDFQLLKALKFWLLRKKSISEVAAGVARANIIAEMLKEFDIFLLRHHINLDENLQFFYYSVNERIFENLLLELQEDNYSNVELIFKVAQSAIKINKATFAVQLLEDAYKLYKKDAAVRLMLACCYNASGNLRESMHHYCHAFLGMPVLSLEDYPAESFFGLASNLRSNGFSEMEISRWMACYAIKHDLFSEVDFCLERSAVDSYEAVVSKHKSLKKKPWLRHEMLPVFAYHALFFITAVEQNNFNFETEGERLFFKEASDQVKKSLERECPALVNNEL